MLCIKVQARRCWHGWAQMTGPCIAGVINLQMNPVIQHERSAEWPDAHIHDWRFVDWEWMDDGWKDTFTTFMTYGRCEGCAWKMVVLLLCFA